MNDPNRPPYPPPPYPPQGYGQGQGYDPNVPPGAYPPYQNGPYPQQPGPYGAPPPRKGSATPWIIGGCLGLLLLSGAVVVLLAFIGASQRPSTGSTITTSSTTSSAPATSDSGAASNPDVEASLQRAAASMQLPWQNGPLTVTAIRADGMTLVMDGSLAEDTSQSGWDSFDNGLRRGLCSSSFGDTIRAGAMIRLGVIDSAGNGHTLFVRDCAG